MGNLDFLERGVEYIRWSLLIVSIDALTLTILLVLSLLVTPLATYILTVVISYFLLISTVIPYALVVILWLIGFRDLARYDGRYSPGFIGAVVTVISYFINIVYMGYLVINMLIGNLLIPKPVITQPIVLTRTWLFIVFSLYLPLPIFTSLILGIIGSVLSMATLYRLGRDFSSSSARLGSVLGIVGALLIEFQPFSTALIGVGTALLFPGLDDVLANAEKRVLSFN
ncbi:MAG: hypothetical protein L7H10_07365 [Vulcanisaeta sp.]|jgi:hypothetical protein|nr:hypothetical protein [Vulcanisaeta sp.]MCG2886003.1 hypothetical protein [Vulcanisaeta sp.]